jgi:ATP-dependent helicase/nuclease subunit A
VAVVAVAGLDKKVKARLPNLALGYESFEDLARVLERARIEYAPAFAAKETNASFEAELEPGAIEEARRLLYVALTRPRETLILEWPEYLAGKDSNTYWSVLQAQCDLQLGAAELRVGTASFPCAVIQGGGAPPEEAAPGELSGHAELPVIGRRAIAPGIATTDLTPDSRAPSSLHGEPGATPGLTVESYGPPLADVDLNGVALGAFLHRCFEVLGPRPGLVARLPALTGVAADAAAMEEVAGAVARFEAWMKKRFAPEAVLREWPVLAVNAEGSVISGTADLVVRTAEGLWIIDHKSDQVEDPCAGVCRVRAAARRVCGGARGGGAKGAGGGGELGEARGGDSRRKRIERLERWTKRV